MATPAPDVTDAAVLRVALVYLLTSFATFLVMGLLGLLMRLDHAGWLSLSHDWFYRVMTIHGTGMVTALLLAGMGGITAVLGRSVRLSARWLWSAFLIYFMSMGFVLGAVLIGNFAGAWTALDPLPFHGLTWGVWAGVAMYVGFVCVGTGFLIWSLHLILSLRAAHGGMRQALGWPYLFSGGRDTSAPVPSPTELAAMVVALLGVVTGVVGIAVLLPLFAQAAGLIGRVNVLYAKNFQMLFGHNLANLAIYLAIGLVYATLPRYTGRSLPTSWLVVFAWNLEVLLILLPMPHHLYQDFAQPLPVQILGQVGAFATAPVIILVTIFETLLLIFRSGLRWTVPSILIVLGLWGWVFGGFGAMLDAVIAVNQVTHNTMWVPAHFHTYYVLGVATFAWGFLYALIGGLGGIRESRWSRLAAWLYGVGAVGFVLMFFDAGAHGVPRRYAVHLPAWHIYAQIAVPFVGLLALSLLWLTIEMLVGLKRAWQPGKPAPPGQGRVGYGGGG